VASENLTMTWSSPSLWEELQEVGRRQAERCLEKEEKKTKSLSPLKKAKEKKRYELLALALKAYVEEHGDAVLPRNFRVPQTSAYPEALWGANLDRRLYCLRFYREHVAAFPERQAELRNLGFIWQRLQPEFNLVVEALVAYRGMFGDVRVPVAFCVPFEGEEWPVATRGMPLGRTCAKIRSRHDYVTDGEKWRQLDSLGFSWGSSDKERKVRRALEVYRKLYGDSKEPPVRFVVPLTDDRWPSQLRGFDLGRKRYDYRRRRQNVNKKIKKIDHRFDVFARALTVFVQTFGHADVPQKFTVPADDDIWPQDCVDMPLGSRVHQIRSKGYYVKGPRAERRKQILDSLGFIWHKNNKSHNSDTS